MSLHILHSCLYGSAQHNTDDHAPNNQRSALSLSLSLNSRAPRHAITSTHKHHQRCESRIHRQPCRCCSPGRLDRKRRHKRCWSTQELERCYSSIQCLDRSTGSELGRCNRSWFERRCKLRHTSEGGSSWACKRRIESRPRPKCPGGTTRSSMPPFLDTVGTQVLGLQTRKTHGSVIHRHPRS